MRPAIFEPDINKHKSCFICAIKKIDCLAITLLFFAFLSGGFSLSRIDRNFRELGWLDNVAYWFLLPLLLLASMTLYKNSALNRFEACEKAMYRSFRAFVLSAILLHCYMALSAFWAPVQNIELSIDIFMLSLYMILIQVFLRGEHERKMTLVIEWTFWSGVIYAIGGVLSSGLEAQRMAAFGGGPNVFVRVVGGGLIAGIYLYFVKKRRLVIIALPVLVLAVVASGSRGGVIGLVLSLIVMSILVLPRYFKWRTIFLSAILGYMVFWIGLIAVDTSGVFRIAKERYYNRTIKTQYLSGRDRCFTDAINIFEENMLVGAGLDSFHIHSTSGIYPHNIILHIGAEGGMIGLIFLFGCLFMMVNRWFKPRKEENDFILILCIFYFFTSLVSGGIYDARFTWLYGALYMLPHREELIRVHP
jgi:O-antigen ligase